jgi:Ca2+-binding RTX toxin-like protein
VTIQFLAEQAAITGYGSYGHNKLSMGDGDDLVFATDKRGTNFIDGGTGNDTIGSADDETEAFEGNESGGADLLNGGDGNDTIYAGVGRDTVQGGDGNDRIDGWFGSDTLKGGDNDDLLLGGDGNDKLYGDDGADKLFDDEDNDTLLGGEDDDAATYVLNLHDHGEKDIFDGGSGNDLLVLFFTDEQQQALGAELNQIKAAATNEAHFMTSFDLTFDHFEDYEIVAADYERLDAIDT